MYKVFRVSENANSFGLKQFYAINEDGGTFCACANSLNMPVIGQDVDINGNWELKENLPDAPEEVIEEVWG